MKRLQTYSLDRKATWIGWLLIYVYVSYIPDGEILLQFEEISLCILWYMRKVTTIRGVA